MTWLLVCDLLDIEELVCMFMDLLGCCKMKLVLIFFGSVLISFCMSGFAHF